MVLCSRTEKKTTLKPIAVDLISMKRIFFNKINIRPISYGPKETQNGDNGRTVSHSNALQTLWIN